MSIRNKITKALRKRYKAIQAEALATIEIYLENPVGIGDHPDFLGEIDKLLEAVSDAKEKLEVLEKQVEKLEEGE